MVWIYAHKIKCTKMNGRRKVKCQKGIKLALSIQVLSMNLLPNDFLNLPCDIDIITSVICIYI